MINGLPIRATFHDVRIVGGEWAWLPAVVVAHDVLKGRFVVWSLDAAGVPYNGHYDIADYGRATQLATDRIGEVGL